MDSTLSLHLKYGEDMNRRISRTMATDVFGNNIFQPRPEYIARVVYDMFPQDSAENVYMGGRKIYTTVIPTEDVTVTNKAYVVSTVRREVVGTGLSQDPDGNYVVDPKKISTSAPSTADIDFTNKAYVDSRVQTAIQEVRLGV